MRIKQLIASEDEFKDFVWSFIDAENHGWREEDLPKLQPFFNFSRVAPSERGPFTDEIRESMDFHDRCCKEYADEAFEKSSVVSNFDVHELAEFFEIIPPNMDCWDTDDEGNDIDEEGNIIPPLSRDTLEIPEGVIYPFIFIGAIDGGFDRCGDFKMMYSEKVELSDFDMNKSYHATNL